MTHNLPYVALVFLPLIMAPLVYLVGRVSLRNGKIWGMSLAKILTVAVFAVEGVLLYVTLNTAINEGSEQITVGTVTMMFDGLGLTVSAVVIALSFCVSIFSIPYMSGENGEEKYYALLLITVGAILGLTATFDLFNLWVWFELMAISTYFLVAFYNEQPASLEAGVKYLVQSAVGSALVMFGIALIFSQTGSVSMPDIFTVLSGSAPLVELGGVLMIVGFGVKAALVPLHTWLPDAHAQAPSGISAMLSGIVIEAGMVAMLRTLSILGRTGAHWGYIILGFGVLNLIIGSLMALRQKQVKRMLAYSSLVHVGYMMLGFGFSLSFGTILGAQGGFFHLMTHSMMKGLAFLGAGALMYGLFISRGDHSPLMIEDLNGAAKKYPVVAFVFSCALLSLGSLPPFGGFMSKWQIMVGGAGTQNTVMIILAVLAGLAGMFSLLYYTPLINRMYRQEPSTAVQNAKPLPWLMVAPLVVMAVVIVFLGVYPKAVEFLTSNAAYSLMMIYGG